MIAAFRNVIVCSQDIAIEMTCFQKDGIMPHFNTMVYM